LPPVFFRPGRKKDPAKSDKIAGVGRSHTACQEPEPARGREEAADLIAVPKVRVGPRASTLSRTTKYFVPQDVPLYMP
jgi:hypothetical protein